MSEMELFECLASTAIFKVDLSHVVEAQSDQFIMACNSGCTMMMRDHLSAGAPMPDKTTVYTVD